MTITIPSEMEARLKGEAQRRGLAADEYARRLIERGLGGAQAESDQATLDVLDRWERDSATTDPADLARREREFEQFKEAMNRNRLGSEGPDARKVYP
jgi:hypothetical protein